MAERIKVLLICTECLSRNYVTSKRKSDMQKRMELMKYCPKCNKHTLHRETK